MSETKRPWMVWLVGLLYMGVGIFTAEQALAALMEHKTADMASCALGLGLGLVAIVVGAYLPLGARWARWLALAWMALHVAISYPVPRELVAHLVILAVIAVLLFLPASRRFFTAGTTA